MKKMISPLFHGKSLQVSDNHRTIHGLLLAAGRSRRFDPTGQQPKLLARLAQGQTLIRQSAQQLLPWVQTLTVVIGPHNVGVVRALAGLPVRVLVCESADQGPGASLRCGLVASVSRPQGWLLALADMPWIAQSTYQCVRQALDDGLVQGQDAVWQPIYQDQPGHPVAVTETLVQLYLSQEHDPKSGLSALWRTHSQWRQRLEIDDAGCIRDVDFVHDLPMIDE